MSTNTGTIMTIANSIIGVSVLAMPFCFKECGIILSVLMLILSSILSRLTCYLLLKAAVMARRRNFEFLAFHIFGPTGKFIAELCIIGFLVGTCIAFFVVVGDLGPAIISTTIDVANSATLRTSVLIGLAVLVVLPLGLLRNVDSLSSVCTATIGFYMCLVLKVVIEALPHLVSGDWIDNVHYWRPAGILQCLPIFSMAMFCQPQLFEIYDSLPNPSLERMNGAVRVAINLCTCVYISVGFFGYIAFCTDSFSGNILMSFKPTLMSDIIKLGFVLSVAVSFPLVIFPCRASLYSLLFRRITVPHHETIKTFIPETKFKCITLFIIVVPLAIGLVIPNIELVLGLVGSTIGVGICVIFPAMAFIFVSTKETADRVIAQFLLFVGVLILVLGTYATLYAANESVKPSAVDLVKAPSFSLPVVENVGDKVNIRSPPIVEKEKVINVDHIAEIVKLIPKVVVSEESVVKKDKDGAAGIARQEPPQPVEPGSHNIPDKSVLAKKSEEVIPDKLKENELPVDKVEKAVSVGGELKEKAKAEEVIDKDALKKEDEELADAEKQAVAASNLKHEEVLRKIEKQDEERNMLIQEQNKILKEILKEKIIENEKKEENPVLSNMETIEIKPVDKKNSDNDVLKMSDDQSKLIRENEIIKEVLLNEQKDIIKKEKLDAQDEKLEKVVAVNKPLALKSIVNRMNQGNMLANELVVPKVPDQGFAGVEDGKALHNIVQVPNQPIAYQQRYSGNENNLKSNNPISQENLDKPREIINENKPISIKSLIMDGQNVKNLPKNSPNINNVIKAPVVLENINPVHNNVIPDFNNELDKIGHVDILKKNVAEPIDEVKAMRRDILETDERKPDHDREKRDTLLEEIDNTNVKSGDITILSEVKEIQDLKENNTKNCHINEEINENVIVPLVELKDAETHVDESPIKIGSRLAEPSIELNRDAVELNAGLQAGSLLNGPLPMKRDLKSVESQQSQGTNDHTEGK